MKEVIWRWEYGLCMPFCPYCDGPAYEEDHCVFCLRKYKYTESPVKDTRVTVGEYTVIQLSNNALYVYKGERCVMHASSAKKMTEDELREMVAHYKELSGTVKPCDMCAYYDTDRKDQPCCSCNGQNFEEADNEQREAD